MMYLLFIFIKLSIGESFIFWTIVAILVVLYKKHKNKSKQLKVSNSRQNKIIDSEPNMSMNPDHNQEIKASKQFRNIIISGFENRLSPMEENKELNILFEWDNDIINQTSILIYKGIKSDSLKLFPRVTFYHLKTSFVNKGDLVVGIKTMEYGFYNIESPVSGVFEILIDENNINIDEYFDSVNENRILQISYSDLRINEYREYKRQKQKEYLEYQQREIERKEEIEKALAVAKIEQEKESIKQKILEKQRRRDLEKAATQELIDDGILFPETKRREPIPREIVDALWNRDKGMCVYCGSKENIHIDHIIPFSKGGSNDIANLQLLCQKCNLEKSNKIG